MTDLQKLKVVDLKKILKDKNLPVTGTKLELIMRLEASYGQKDPVNSENNIDSLIDVDILLEDTTVSSTITSVPIPSLPPKIEKISMAKSSTNGIVDRIKRFGPVSSEAQKTLREQRFNNGTQPNAKLNNKANVEDVLKLRKERFSKDVAASDKIVTSNGDEKLDKRANRFGLTTNSVAPSTKIIDSAILKRKERFGVIVGPTDASEEKKMKRAERFGIK